MKSIKIEKAEHSDCDIIAELIENLLIELEPNRKTEIKAMNLSTVTKQLLTSNKISSFMAKYEMNAIGVITLYECSAIYAGGTFGEISELYVSPDFRQMKVGELLINEAIKYGKSLGWLRLEVGSPPPETWARTVQFYKKNKFDEVGMRLRRII